jgi:protocatechuate 3,4-dioxygenase beta subunit
MKNLTTYLRIAFLIGIYTPLLAQQSVSTLENAPSDYLTRNPLYDYSEVQLNNTDTIPDYASKENKLMITGTIYQSDGITPADNVILYISQTDENGSYDVKVKDEKRYAKHRGWIKTDADGRYTFFTFIPGSDRRLNEMQHIHAAIKAPGTSEQDIDAFLFDEDPLLTKHCRKRLAKKGIDSILKPVKKDNMLVATRNIVLQQETSDIK